MIFVVRHGGETRKGSTMKKNRRKRVQVKFVPRLAVGCVALAATFTVMYLCLDSKCTQLGQEIRKSEQRFASLENERLLELAKWNERKTPEKLERAMLQHGLAMGYPKAEQVVRVDPYGTPLPQQPSMIAFRRMQAGAGERAARVNTR